MFRNGALTQDSIYQDHSVFAGPYSTGISDLRQVLLAHSIHSATTPSPPIALIAGMLLIHCVAEDTFWLLDGLVGKTGILRGYFPSMDNRPDGSITGPDASGRAVDKGREVDVDVAAFTGLLAGSEKAMSKKFKELGLQRMSPSPQIATPPSDHILFSSFAGDVSCVSCHSVD